MYVVGGGRGGIGARLHDFTIGHPCLNQRMVWSEKPAPSTCLLLLLCHMLNETERSVDCWALGILTYEFTAGYTPFQPPGAASDITALFTRIASFKSAAPDSAFLEGYDEKVFLSLLHLKILLQHGK